MSTPDYHEVFRPLADAFCPQSPEMAEALLDAMVAIALIVATNRALATAFGDVGGAVAVGLDHPEALEPIVQVLRAAHGELLEAIQ